MVGRHHADGGVGRRDTLLAQYPAPNPRSAGRLRTGIEDGDLREILSDAPGRRVPRSGGACPPCIMGPEVRMPVYPSRRIEHGHGLAGLAEFSDECFVA